MRAADLLQLFVQNVVDYAIFLLDRDGFVTSWNPGAERLKGYRADEIVGKHFSTFYTPEEAAKPRTALRVALTEGRFEDEGWRVRKDGSLFWANVVITPVHDESGQHLGFGKVTRDLTERRRADEERVKLAEARAEISLRDKFFSIASHELRTPLGALRLELASIELLLQRDPASVEAARERVHVAVAQIRRLSDLIERLLDVSRLRTGRLAIVLEDVEAGKVARDVRELMEPLARSASCEIRLQVPNVPVEARWDRLRMEQVLLNLLSNAVRYGAGKPIDLEVNVRGDAVAFSVSDRGGGIAESEKERIFRAFERGVSPDTFGGLGLGLYVARQIVQAHGGTIRVDSEPGAGATFVVVVPRFASAAEAPEEQGLRE